MALTKALGRVLGGSGAAGSGLTARALGETLGIETKTLSISEMPAHTHATDFSARQLTDTLANRNALVASGTGSNTQTYTSQSVGGGTAFSMMQPSVFYNIFFKL